MDIQVSQYDKQTGSFSERYAKQRAKRGKWRMDEPLAEGLAELFKGDSVVDLGAGIGLYVEYFLKARIECFGLDGIPNIMDVSKGSVTELDLASPVPNIYQRDWVLCLEVGEHIPIQKEDMFVRNLILLNRKGIVLSWAAPGQRGKGHVNCRSTEYVRDRIGRCGYTVDDEKTKELRSIATEGSYQKNLLVFLRD